MERIDCPLILLLIFLSQTSILIPKRKCCERSTKYKNSACGPKGIVAVSSQLLIFLVSRYNAADDWIRWLCPKCHAFEWNSGLFLMFSLSLTIYHRVFRENSPELDIFHRKGPIFFSSKVFSRAYRHFERKKNFFQKVVGSRWIHP